MVVRCVLTAVQDIATGHGTIPTLVVGANGLENGTIRLVRGWRRPTHHITAVPLVDPQIVCRETLVARSIDPQISEDGHNANQEADIVALPIVPCPDCGSRQERSHIRCSLRAERRRALLQVPES